MPEPTHNAEIAPASEKAPLWKRLLPVAFGLIVVVVIFGWALPQVIDYEAVFRVIGNIDITEWLVLIVLAAVRFIPRVGSTPRPNRGSRWAGAFNCFW